MRHPLENFLKSFTLAVAMGLMAMGAMGIRAPVAAEAEPAKVEEAEAPENAISSPPMSLDDPGTPGRQGIEVNLVGTLVRAGSGRGSESLLDANYGIGDRIQLKFERPYVTESATGEPSQKGLGATELGIKWRFVDHAGLEMAVYPNYEFDNAFTLKDAEGVPEEKAGTSFYLPLLISKTVKRVYSIGANLGYRKTQDSSRDDTIVALGIGRSLGSNARILGEIYSERDQHWNNRQTDARIGYVRTLFPKWLADTGFEVPGFISLGRSIGAIEEGETSTSFTFGISFIKLPVGE